MGDKFSIITYSDGNHSPRVYVNRKFVGWLDGTEIIMNLLKVGNQLAQINNYEEVNIYLEDLDEEIAEDVHNIMSFATELTQEQEDAILKREYASL